MNGEILRLRDTSSASIRETISAVSSPVLFLGDPRCEIGCPPHSLERMAQALADTGAAWVYSDAAGHARIDYQSGSIRDTFDFGPLVAISAEKARSVDLDGSLRWGGLYDLRLKLSERFPVVRIPEPLYSASIADNRASGQEQFDYVDPKNRDYQIEMERVATAHLKRIGAYLEPEFETVPAPVGTFPVVASVVIPVRNRERTVLEAVESALGQRTSFAFNVIVVDNHSTDRTTELLSAVSDSRLVHLIPRRRDLGIGGCWNEAIFSPVCGQYAVQLDSDDLYSGAGVLALIVDTMRSGPFAMLVGSYTTVDFSLKPIGPGLVDHREWTRENGRNNALRINGLGAPRAFDVSVLRRFGFPDVSYGEDYAVGLRLSRQFEIGRIFDSSYLCRRWEGNTDSALPLETMNRHDAYKDWLRTVEIRHRQMRGGRQWI